MNTFPLSNPNEQLEPEELEFWELKEFDDVLQGFEVSEFDNEFTENDNFKWYAGRC